MPNTCSQYPKKAGLHATPFFVSVGSTISYATALHRNGKTYSVARIQVTIKANRKLEQGRHTVNISRNLRRHENFASEKKFHKTRLRNSTVVRKFGIYTTAQRSANSVVHQYFKAIHSPDLEYIDRTNADSIRVQKSDEKFRNATYF